MSPLPGLFVSHGAPTLVVGASPAKAFLQQIGARLGRPRAILVASAHWETGLPRIGGAPRPATMHDLCAATRGLHRCSYGVPGDPALARRVADLLGAAGMAASVDPDRGLDVGAWTPLLLMYPAADVPVVPLSIQPALGAAHHLALGRALRPLLDEGVLVVGSGSATHNVLAQHGRAEDAPAPEWVTRFQDWLAARLAAGDVAAVLDARCHGPAGRENHPTAEHLLPLYVALGAAGEGATAERLHRSHTHGVLAMDAYAFTPASGTPALAA
ncbi:MAG: dioxygenase [Alphaproteobacteria bacterium]|nr:dioxygenase [Alphaproteobacteria bacterium]